MELLSPLIRFLQMSPRPIKELIKSIQILDLKAIQSLDKSCHTGTMLPWWFLTNLLTILFLPLFHALAFWMNWRPRSYWRTSNSSLLVMAGSAKIRQKVRNPSTLAAVSVAMLPEPLVPSLTTGWRSPWIHQRVMVAPAMATRVVHTCWTIRSCLQRWLVTFLAVPPMWPTALILNRRVHIWNSLLLYQNEVQFELLMCNSTNIKQDLNILIIVCTISALD